ncbi:hypothetical protein ABZW96_31320 [Nocardia sp. NPDC004168]|uniref:hypothetical protein n=1 Tax=Nocardia sp. NPDC004168 TaxID=3154452 RepID=UPI0033A6A293
MTRTTPPRAVDVAAACPALAPLARPATRLHPRSGTPTVYDSSIGGPLLWPTNEPWPHCHGPHNWDFLTNAWNPHELNPLQSLVDAKLTRHDPEPWPSVADVPSAMLSAAPRDIWEFEVSGWDLDNLNLPPSQPLAGRWKPTAHAPNAMLPVAQLYTRDVPGLRPPPGKDLLQILWCPLDNADAMPETALVWRTAADVTDFLNNPPIPAAVEYGYDYIPLPCTVEPERIIEYPSDFEELGGEPLEQMRQWASRQHTGIDPDDIESWFIDNICVAPGWKVGGHIRWGTTDPFPQPCPTCGTETEPLLTIASSEWDAGTHSWIPYEDQALAGDYSTTTGPDVTIARGYNMILRVCPISPDHPHIQLMQ